MDRRRYHPSMANAGATALLKTTTNPHHRAILENYRLHGLFEITLNWERILTPEMTVDHPHYVHSDGTRTTTYDGRDRVWEFYHNIEVGGLVGTVGPIDEKVMVGDWGFASHGLWGLQLPGPAAAQWELEGADDLDATYYMTQKVSQIWLYDQNAKLIGENIMEDPSTRTVWKLAPSEVMTFEESHAINSAMLEELLAAQAVSS